MKDYMEIDLRLFDGEGGASGATGAGGADGAGDTGEAGNPDGIPANPRRSRSNPLAGVKYGRQPDAGQSTQQQEGQRDDGAGEDLAAQWAELKKGKFKQFFDGDVQGIVKDRLKNAKATESQLKALAPMIQSYATKYGKDPTDIDGIMAAYTDDDALYEDEAIEKGVPVSMVKNMHKLQAQVEAQKAAEQQSQQELFIQQHLQKLAQQAEVLKQTYPQFDLMSEMQNEAFRRMTSPDGGLTVEQAFHALHWQEIEGAQMQFAIQRTQQKMANAIASGQKRPPENGAGNAGPSLDIRDDPRKWTKQDREEVRRRVARGEKIIL